MRSRGASYRGRASSKSSSSGLASQPVTDCRLFEAVIFSEAILPRFGIPTNLCEYLIRIQ